MEQAHQIDQQHGKIRGFQITPGLFEREVFRMTLDQFLNIFTQVIFLFAAGITLLSWMRHRDQTHLDVALVFVSLALAIIAQDAMDLFPVLSPVLTIVFLVALISQPYFLLRVARYFRSVPLLVQRAASIGLLLTCASLIFLEIAPIPVVILFILYFTLMEIYAGYLLVQGALTIPGITGWRLRLASIGSGSLALAFLVVFILLVVVVITGMTELPGNIQTILGSVIQVLALLAGIGYYFGFAPPRWLRRYWQLSILPNFMRLTSERKTGDRTRVFNELSQGALRTIGGEAALIAECDADGQNLRITSQSIPGIKMTNLERDTGSISRIWSERQPGMIRLPADVPQTLNDWSFHHKAKTLFVVPVIGPMRAWGMLLVALRYEPLFPQDDLKMLALLAERSVIPLDYSMLVEDALHDSEEQIAYQAHLLENVNDAVIGSDENSILRFWNRGAENMFGWKAEEVIGRSGRDILRSEILDGDRETVLKTLAETGRWSGEVRLHHKDGSVFITEISSITLRSANGEITGYVSVHRDISDRKRAEEEIRKLNEDLEQRVIERTGQLRESEEKFSKAFLTSPAGIGISRASDGRYIDVNETLAQMTGYTREELIGRTSAELGMVDSEERQKVLEASQKTGSVRDVEIQVRTKSGSAIDVLVSIEQILIGGQVCLLTLQYDITKRKRAEAEVRRLNEELEQRQVAIQQTNALLQTLMDNMPDHIYFKDMDSRFIRNSRSQARMMGFNDPMQVIGRSDFDFFPHEHANRSYKEEQGIITSGQSLLDIEERVVWPDGRITWVSTTKLPLRDAENRVVGTFGISRDITERKKAEEELGRANAQLESTNKELEAFSYSVSHDLRAPLRTIDGFSQAVIDDYGKQLPEDGLNYLLRVRKAAQHMANLIDDLLNLSRYTRAPMKTETVNLTGLANEIKADLQQAHPDRNVKMTIAPNMKTRGDAQLLRVVVENLLNNAWKFSSKQDQAEVEFGSKRGKDEMIYFVRDNGAGFDMAYAGKLFGAFQRLHAMTEFPGTGVGLATVQRIINRHGGRIWAESELGKGATFFFSLPSPERAPKAESEKIDTIENRAREII